MNVPPPSDRCFEMEGNVGLTTYWVQRILCFYIDDLSIRILTASWKRNGDKMGGGGCEGVNGRYTPTAKGGEGV